MSIIRSLDLIKPYLIERGYTIRPITLGQSPYSKFIIIESPSGKFMTLSVSRLSYPFGTNTAKEIIDNKIRSYDFARMLDMSIPYTIDINTNNYDLAILRDMLKKYPKLIVKPHNGLQSRGLTLDITSENQLIAALQTSSQISPTAIVQEQFTGEEIRFIAINGAIVAALLRQKPHVIGDGTSSIAKLIKNENQSRSKINSMVPYPKLDSTNVNEALLTNSYIPAPAEVIELNKSTMIRGGASVYNIISTIHPSYTAIADKAAKMLGKGFISVDIMTKDHTAPATKDNYIFLEFNSSASLPMCYSCRDGKNFKIVEEYIGPMLERAIN